MHALNQRKNTITMILLPMRIIKAIKYKVNCLINTDYPSTNYTIKHNNGKTHHNHLTKYKIPIYNYIF